MSDTGDTNGKSALQSTHGVPLDAEQLNIDSEGSQLDKLESFWRDHHPWLKQAGYALRPRYHPCWIASWLVDTQKSKYSAEDYINTREGSLIDGIREKDGLQVMLKRINLKYHPAEVTIANLFSSEPLASDPRNHCIPIYEVLTLPGNSDIAILVMPFLQPFNDPPFVCLQDIVDFFQQLLEGLQFMHQQNVAHCDVKVDNVMSDARPFYKVPPHPLRPKRPYTGSLDETPKLASKRMPKSLKHYLVDFGISSMHPPGSSRLQSPGYGGTHTVPEFQNGSTQPCDPFAVDVYCMGDFIRTRFRQGEKYSAAFNGLEFMDALLDDMVQDDPKKRPTMDEVVERFFGIVDGLTKRKLMSRASTVDETTSGRIIKNVRYWIGL